MNSNKKILNPKNNRPWLLCPSKTFPGKFYYFNVSTGEAAWCISETDKKLKEALINRVTDKSHSYPEPSQAPIGNSTNKTKSFISQENAGITEFQNANVFGETVFPEYVPPDDSTPNYGRTFTPMYGQSQHRPSNVFQFQKQPFQSEDLPVFDQTANFSSFKLSKESHTLAKPFMKDEASQTFLLRFQSESDSTAKSALKGSRSVENLSTPFTKDVETSTISPPQKVDNETGKLRELDKNDLRFKLIAKRRQVKCTTETEKAGKSTAQSTSKSREVLTPQKRVTFDIQDSEASNAITQDLQETDQNPETSRAEELKQQTPDGVWYVVADTAVLLAGLQWVEKFVKSDALCRLLIPHAVYTEVEQRSRGDSGTFLARRLLRKLAVQNSHIIVQRISDDELSLEDSLLECCWTLLQEDCHVVLISNNTKLLNEAKSIDLKCYTIDEIKNHNKADAGPLNDRKKLNIKVGNDKNISEKSFIQDLNQINGQNKRDGDKLINLTKPHNKVNTVFPSEIPTVNNHITKPCIADSRPVSNQTEEIMKNVFSTTGFDDKIDRDKSVDIENKHQGLSKLVDNSNKNQSDVQKNLSVIEEIHADKEEIIGIMILKNECNLDKDLERFHVKNTMVENRIKSRLEEWMCRLNQTMEGFLTEILLKEKTKMKGLMPPWNLFEAIQVTGEAFKKQPYIKTIIDRFSMKVLNCSSDNGKLNKDIKPVDFMMLVGLSMILIEHLKEVVNCKELSEADVMIVDLIKNIEDPNTDIDLTLEYVNTPRSEMAYDKAPAQPKSRTEIRNQPKVKIISNSVVIPASNDKILEDLALSVSSVNPECAKAYTLIKVFLVKVKRTLLEAYEFMKQSMRQYEKGMPVHVLTDIQLKALRGREHIQKITENLKGIIVRESSTERTVKNILTKTGEYKEDDPVVNNYKETIAIFLKNTELTEKALGSMLSLFKCNSVKEKKESCSRSQVPSPILPARKLPRNARHTKGGKMNGNKS